MLGIQFARIQSEVRIKKREIEEYPKECEVGKKRRREEKAKCGLAGAKWDLNRAEQQ